jgi:hypothetical protein
MKPARILSAAAIVFLLAACDTGGTRITAPDHARYDGGNTMGSGNRQELGGMGSGNITLADGTNTMGSGGIADGGNTMGSGNLTAQTPGTGVSGSGSSAQSDSTVVTERGGNFFGSGN